MSVNQTQPDILKLEKRALASTAARWRQFVRARILLRVAAIVLILLLAGGGSLQAEQARTRAHSMAVAGWGFDLLGWETHAILEKAVAAVTRPSGGLAPQTASQVVVDYMTRADRIGQLEAEVSRLLSEGHERAGAEIAGLERELEALRAAQADSRLQVEQVIERQISYVLAQSGFRLAGNPFPPVQFTFTEPPKKLVVSPRDRIATEHSRMLSPGIPLSDIEEAEAAINQSERARSYITNIGGLGAFPTMVVDRASLSWVLSTVAHEWAHNYLTLFPLGWNYFKNQDMTTLNESVAEIVGNEIGAQAERLFYAAPGDALSGEKAESTERIPVWERMMEQEARFNFREEMRATRLRVDELLSEGRVEEAEQYMEERRQVFVEHGIPLRVLNQAYFAFHGSYGTSAASTSPIGPKLDELRDLTPDLDTFLTTVRGFNEVEDLDAALAEWTSKSANDAE